MQVDEPKQPAEQSALTLIAWFKRAVAATLLIAIVKCSFFAGRDFEQRSWYADSDGKDGVRHAMGLRLAQRQTLVGKGRAEVVELLGEPITWCEFTGWDLVYDLGPARGFLAFFSDFLVVKLGPSGAVVASRIMTDG